MSGDIKTIEIGQFSGTVFFDDGWEAFGWKTESVTNGPYDTADEAEQALRDELAALAEASL